jgi:hypothetical protein
MVVFVTILAADFLLMVPFFCTSLKKVLDATHWLSVYVKVIGIYIVIYFEIL